jgi:uncharacterized paraquat-inducible protein A
MNTILAVCKHCGLKNSITAAHLNGRELVSCSRCHEPLGRWRDLPADTGAQDLSMTEVAELGR